MKKNATIPNFFCFLITLRLYLPLSPCNLWFSLALNPVRRLVPLPDAVLLWVFMVLLALIWGSSFLLLKHALLVFAPLQVSAGRMFFACMLSLPWALRFLRRIPREAWGPLILFTLTANIATTFLTAQAQVGLGSSAHATLYTMTPLMTLLVGVFLYRQPWSGAQMMGLLLGLGGSVLLAFRGGDMAHSLNPYALLALLATACNGLFTNMIKFNLRQLTTLEIASVSFLLILPLTAGYLLGSGFFTQAFTEAGGTQGLAIVAILGGFGNALALVMLSEIVRISSPVVASLVMYWVPVVALVWGYLDHERISWRHLLSLALILTGVWIVNRSRRRQLALDRK